MFDGSGELPLLQIQSVSLYETLPDVAEYAQDP